MGWWQVGRKWGLLALTVVATLGILTAESSGPAIAAPLSSAPVVQGGNIADSPIADRPSLPTTTTALGPDPGKGFIRLPGHVPAALSYATLARDAPVRHSRLTLTLVLRRRDEAGFQDYLRAVSEPSSPRYRQFLTPRQLTARYSPTFASYRSVLQYLNREGFHLVSGSANRMTLTVEGSLTAAERAFKIDIHPYRLGAQTAYANDSDPALPRALAAQVLAIDGLSALAQPMPVLKYVEEQCQDAYKAKSNQVICKQIVSVVLDLFTAVACAYALPALEVGAVLDFDFFLYACGWDTFIGVYNAGGEIGGALTSPGSTPFSPPARSKSSRASAAQRITGAGQIVGLLEFDAYHSTDVADFLALIGAPASLLGNVTTKSVGGGVASPGAGESEVLLDIDTLLALAPGAKVNVYEAPFGGSVASYAAVFNAMINDGVTIISNSWASCEDQVSLAEAQSIDSILQTAAAAGISVFNGTGDSGAACLDGSANTIAIPADSPNATAVGGTSWPQGPGPGLTYSTETWWDGSQSNPITGQGGFGVSRYFSKPSYQSALTGTMRSVPDVVALADPINGVPICQADAGGCPNGNLNGGTSLAAPTWAAITALLNQSLGHSQGLLNPKFYGLAGTAAFHNAASMGSDAEHVGLGSPNVNVLAGLLHSQTPGAPSLSTSMALPLAPLDLATFSATGFTTPADGTSQSGVLVVLADANGNTLSGKTVTLTASGGHALISPASGVTSVANGAVAFTVTDPTAESVTLTATDTTDGLTLAPASLTFAVPSAASGGISANPPSVPADGQTSASITVTLTDSLGRAVPGKTVTLADGGAHAVLTGPTPGITDANGQIQFAATDQVNEAVTFMAIDVTDGNLAIPGSATVTYSNSLFSACGVGVAPIAASGYTITPYITGLPAAPTAFLGGVNATCPGGSDPTFTPQGNALVSDSLTGGIYQLGPGGGAASTSNLLNTLAPFLSAPVYGKDGSAYSTVGNVGGQIIQIDPATGAQVRVVASGLTCPAGLAVDPLSGDLFFDDECTGGGLDNASIWRVVDPSNSNPASPTSVVVYATLPTTPNAGLVFAPNGTLYAVSGYYVSPTGQVEQVSATSAATVTVTPVNGVSSDYLLALGSINADGSVQSLITESSGTLAEVPLANPAAQIVLATGTPGVGVVGPDGCMYSARYDTVYRLANSSGPCTFTPSNPAPAIGLSPLNLAVNPTQGSSQTFTAQLRNVSPLAGVPIYFTIAGANAGLQLAHTDANGNASLTYTAALAGADTIVASAIQGSNLLQSNPASITWNPGPDVTYLSLNPSPQSGVALKPVTVSASLSDVTVLPLAPAANQTVTFSLGSAGCTATSGSNGVASCQLTPGEAGAATLTASFAGTSKLTAASVNVPFNVFGTPTPPPSVTMAVSPSDVSAGSPATLSWSSTNATTCSASGAWSGTQTTSGSLSVTQTSTGSYTYTLSCTGAGGSASASAVLAVTLVKVTVTAKSGGGSIDAPLCVCLALLLAMRFRRRTQGVVRSLILVGAVVLGTGGAAHADETAVGSGAADTTASWGKSLYAGLRAGSMPIHVNAGDIEAGLANRGYSAVAVATESSKLGATFYIGYSLAPHAALEFGYTHRDAEVANLSGTVAAITDIPPLRQDTSELIRGYGNIFSLSFRSRFELAPRFFIDPRIGGFFWDSEVMAQSAGASSRATHQGGGLTAGVGLGYRIWHGLEFGVGADYFHGSPSNIATLYAASLQWSFGR